MSKCRKPEDIGVIGSDSGKVMDSGGVDLFSNLPDNVVTTIFSFLPMKEAIGTCILSKKLRHLWTSIPNLEFKESVDHCLRLKTDGKRWELIQIINKFLEHRNSPIRSFRLSFYPDMYSFSVARWITLLMENSIEELDLQFLYCPPMHGELPSCLFSLKTLRVLKLRSCVFKPPYGFIGFSSLETVLLGDMSLSEDLIRSLLSECNLLHSLTLQNCEGFEEIKISDLNTRLSSLTLENCHAHIEIDAPNLKTLCFRGERITFSLKEASNVGDVIIFRGERLPFIDESRIMKTKILENLVHVQSLSLAGCSFKCFAAGNVPDSLHSEYLGLVKLELEMCFWNRKELRGLACLLRSSKGLEKLVVSMSNAFPIANYYGGCRVEDGYWGNKARNDLADECFKHLQWMEINKFTGECGVDFIKFVLANAKQLRITTINPVKEMDLNQRSEFAKLFTRFSNASTYNKIVVNMFVS